MVSKTQKTNYLIMDFLDFMTSLTGAEANARAGQNAKVKAKVITNGRSFILGKTGIFGEDSPIISQFAKDQILGILQETVIISVPMTGSTKYQKVFYSKVTLETPFYDKDENYIEYMFFQSKDLAFVSSSAPIVATTPDAKILEPLYSVAVSGIKLREQPNLTAKYRLISYGDIVGYTDNTTKTYLTTTFWKVYNAKGVAIGWVGKGDNFTSKTPPQAKALPNVKPDGTTDQSYGALTPKQDPQGGNSSSGVSWTTVLAYSGGGVILLYLIIKGIAAILKPKPISTDGTQAR